MTFITGLEIRKGTNKDAEELKRLLDNYGFQTEVHQDLKHVDAILVKKQFNQINTKVL